MSVTITNGATVLTLAYDPSTQGEPSEWKTQRATALSLGRHPIGTEYVGSRVRTRLRLELPYLSKSNVDTLLTLFGMTGLVTITVKKEFPATSLNPTTYQGVWAEDEKQKIEPLLADSLARDEQGTWLATPADLQVYKAVVELLVTRNDE